MKRAHVPLGSRSYDVLVGAGLLRSMPEHLKPVGDWQKAAIVTDSNVEPHYADLVAKQLQSLGSVDRLVVQPGEGSKSWEVAGSLLEDLAALKLRRHDLIVTLGGGMISDLGGFVASTYLRGIRVMHIPTTLLGQVDAAIGGKTGVNLVAGKNLAGTFHQPSLVLCDIDTLLSLPQSEFRSGLAEVIKYGLCFDPQILRYLNERTDLTEPSVLEELVFKCAAIKAGVVSGDERDQGGRLILNYGHTFGHALEAAGGFRRWSHGQAISVGMVFAANLARTLGMAGEGVVDAHLRVFEAAGLPTRASFDPGEVAALWEIDKKRDVSQRWVLLEALGKPVIRSDVEPPHIQTAMKAVLS